MPNPLESPARLTAESLQAALTAAQIDLPTPIVKQTTGSTNADVITLALDGAPDWTTVTAEEQTSGRGRLDRRWEAEAGDALLISVLVRTDGVNPEDVGWIPLLTGLALVAVAKEAGVGTGLKWPNDLVVDGDAHDGSAGPRKLAGILVERSGDAAIVGIGLNVSTPLDRLATPMATSLALEKATNLDRPALFASIMRELNKRWQPWVSANGNAQVCGLLDEYRENCLTIGHEIVATLSKGEVHASASGIDRHGHLLIAPTAGGPPGAIAAGDVLHVR